VTTLEGMEFCLVPSGPFWMGERDEKHLNECLNYDYWIGRYPVIQAHFSAFVEAGGYREPRYWWDAHGVWKSGQIKEWRDDTPRDRPVNYGEPYNLANHPVVGVTWYKALAFTRWLSEQWRDNLPERWGAHLPSEAEWEKAARGGMDIPAKAIILSAGAVHSRHNLSLARNPQAKRLYPWDNEPDPNRANYDDSKVNASSAVGCFPSGVSPYGCEEMSGNVWEWCHSLYRSYPYRADDGREDESGSDPRVWRGGAFYVNARNVRCAYRNYLGVPDDLHDFLGFRVVVSPFFSER
jgi:formylglycine-generating enzyme required for sulfatase activity